MFKATLTFQLLLLTAIAHVHDEQLPFGYVKYPYQAIYPGDGEVTADAVFAGITTFAGLPWVKCLTQNSEELFDIAIIGAPFDTGTSYRPGARFGPSGIRSASRRLTLYGGYNPALEINPLRSGLKLVDCGDIPVTPYDKKHAIQQIEEGHKTLLQRQAFSPLGNDSATGRALIPLSTDGMNHPRIITLGGDHTIVLPVLRSINSVYGPISVIHFDSHLDTWKPSVFGGAPSTQAAINHGTYFYWASKEGLLHNGTCIASIYFCLPHDPFLPTKLSGPSDYDNDDASGFQRIEAREIDIIGTAGIIKKIRETVGDRPVYLSIDIDSLDIAHAPATGTPEIGGWTTREMLAILRGLSGLHIVSADLVEVAPAYDTNAETTTIAAADILYEVISIMVKTPLGKVADN
ncbi:Putative agmatinase 1 [Leucoagaricus sp. SymC.cos]|nr:Putative agmatinase 1 [Leucoagaricus sp. SymC.cos]